MYARSSGVYVPEASRDPSSPKQIEDLPTWDLSPAINSRIAGVSLSFPLNTTLLIRTPGSLDGDGIIIFPVLSINLDQASPTENIKLVSSEDDDDDERSIRRSDSSTAPL